MSRADDADVIDRFDQFYRDYYRDEIGDLAQKYPNERRSLVIDWTDLYRFDPDLADDVIAQPGQMVEYAEEALRLYDLPVDVTLGQAHVRVQNLQETIDIRDIRARHRGQLVAVSGIIRKATDVRPKITEAAFECQRCGTLSRIPQTGGEFFEPHECQGCERQGPFTINFDQSEFVDAQKLRVQESPEGLRGGETPQSIDVHIDDDITGDVTAGDHVRVTGILRLDQQGNNQESSPIFDVYLDGLSVAVEDEQFEEMEITEEDKETIIELSEDPDIYEKMVGSMAPSIFGYDEQKLAIILQLFSGVTKHLPDGSRIRGDLHLLLIGDPGTGKCLAGHHDVSLADGSSVPIRELVESHLSAPELIDDGYHQTVDIPIPTIGPDGSRTQGTITRVWKRQAPATMYHLETRTGHTLDLTPSHPLFVVSQGQVIPKPAAELSEADYLAIPAAGPNDPDDLIPGVGKALMAIRDSLEFDLTSFDLDHSRYRAIESGDVLPTRRELQRILDSIESQFSGDLRSGTVSTTKIDSGPRDTRIVVSETPERSHLGRSPVVSDGGLVTERDTQIETHSPSHIFDRLRQLVHADLSFDAISHIETVPAEDNWVYDVEVAGTHNYIADGILSHNSQLLQYVRNLAPRSIYTSGKGSSTAGLTAAAIRDDFGDGQQWTLEAGALVLADQGIAAVDELDKMRCVTGDTIVATPDGELPIAEFVPDSPDSEQVEELPTGRTIRDIEAFVYSMTETGEIVERAVTAVHEYAAPQELISIAIATGQSLRATPDHPCFVFKDHKHTLRPASEIEPGDELLIPTTANVDTHATDGGVVRSPATYGPDVGTATVVETDRILGAAEPVYDLTVTGTHNFVANGMIIHNSEDRSAMHEALEQQSYHPDTEILLTDGRRIRIGDLVDGRITEDSESVVKGVDCEILPVDDLSIHSIDLDRDEIKKVPVDRVSRHTAPEFFYEVTFSNGRSVTVTPEHPCFVYDAGRVKTIPADALKAGMTVPAPSYLPNSNAPVTLAASKGTDVDLPGDFPADVTSNVAELVGIYVGHCVLSQSSRSASTQVTDRVSGLLSAIDIEIRASVMSANETSVDWDALATMFESIGINDLPSGRIPSDILGSSRQRIRQFLIGVCVALGQQPAAGSIETPTKRSAEDLADALLKLGITTSIHATADRWCLTITNRDLDRFSSYVAKPAEERQTGPTQPSESVELPADIYQPVTIDSIAKIPNDGELATNWVYDITVEPTHSFVGQGVLLHNSISISKAGINATLKSRCSLLGAANPKYGRFDQYEPIGEQIELEPALISRFDLIFTVTDQPDKEKDRNLADHIIQTNYAGELQTHREQTATSNVTESDIQAVSEEVEPVIDPDLLRKYIAYAKRNCFPTMTDAAKEAIRDFYVDLRAQGQDADAPVPVTARKLEALVRLSEASARLRLSDTVELDDAERVIRIVRSCLRDIGVDPETGEFDADVIETGTSKSQRDRIKNIKALITELESEYDEGAPIEEVLDRAEAIGMERDRAEHEIEKLRRQGDVYEPQTDHLRTV